MPFTLAASAPCLGTKAAEARPTFAPTLVYAYCIDGEGAARPD